MGRGRRVREEERERKGRKQIHTTSEIEENCGGGGGESGSSQQAARRQAQGGSAEAAYLHLSRGGSSPQPRGWGIGAGMRLPNCCRLAAIGAMLAACAVRGAGASVRGA